MSSSTTLSVADMEKQYDATQVKLMNEKCILVDDNDVVQGYETKKFCHLMENINANKALHRAFSVFLFNTKGQLLLQQRSSEKITFPDYWTNTCCSHPLYFENDDGTPCKEQPELEPKDNLGVRRAAQRKLEHELGIKPVDVDLDEFTVLTRIRYKAASSDIWGEHEVDYVLFLQKDIDYTPNPNEVRDSRYVTIDELKELVDTADATGVKITPWFRLIFDSFLSKWWKSLDNLAQFQDNDIHAPDDQK